MIRNLAITVAVCALVACGDNNEHKLTVTLFAAAPDAIEVGQSSKLLFVVDPPDADVNITTVGDVSGQTEATVTPTVTTTYDLTATKGKNTATSSVTITVGPRQASGLRVDVATMTPEAGAPFAVTVTALAGDGSTAVGYRGTVHLSSSDGSAVLPGNLVFDAAAAGVQHAMVTLKSAGLNTVTGTDVVNTGTSATASVTVQPGPAASYELSALPSTAAAGQALVLTITALDAFGNLATSYTGQAAFSSGDATDELPATGGFTAGVRTVNLAFDTVGVHAATVSEVSGAITATTTDVTIGSAAPIRIAITGANPSTIAGTDEAFTATLFDLFDNPCTNFAGTVHFTATDPQAAVPADYTFTPFDAGSHAFSVTFKTAGVDSLTIADTSSATTAASNTWNVAGATASTCVATQAPSTAAAGSVVGLTVLTHDQFGNVATTYAGTMQLTATDVRAVLPPNVTYVPAVDAGSHAFSAALLTTGAQTLTATDTVDGSITCNTTIAITPAAPKIVMSLPGGANAGYGVTVGVAVRDVFDNPITNFAGTVSFTSSDSGVGAVTPAPIVFTGSEGGVGSSSATFMTIGTQTVTASDGASANGVAQITVHGLVYTPPATGRVRLVPNVAQTNANVIQLDLIANERLEVGSFFGGGPGSFAAGMNLPLDTTRVAGDTTLFVPGAALPAGTGTRAAAAAIGATDHVLYAAVSRKRVAGTIFTQESDVQAGQVFYSVRLKLTQAGTVGPVFDGAQPLAQYHASVRDQYGDDFVNQGDFGVGRLEIR